MVVDADPLVAAEQRRQHRRRWGISMGRAFEKGNVSMLVAFLIMLLGIALFVTSDGKANPGYEKFTRYLVSFGLMAFSGGFTNWVAIKMLFHRVPGLAGSGIIPQRYVEIRSEVMVVILGTFFDPGYLEK